MHSDSTVSLVKSCCAMSKLSKAVHRDDAAVLVLEFWWLSGHICKSACQFIGLVLLDHVAKRILTVAKST